MNTATRNTMSDIQRGIAAVESEARAAQQRYQAAAFAFAKNREDEGAKRAVLDAKQALDLLEAELTGLRAAEGGARQAHDRETVEGDIATTDKRKADADKALSAVVPAFDDAAVKLAAFAAAFRAAHDVARNAVAAAGECIGKQEGLSSFAVATVGAQALPDTIDAMVSGLLHAHGIHLTPERIDEVLARDGKPDRLAASRILAREVSATTARVDSAAARIRRELDLRLARLPAAA